MGDLDDFKVTAMSAHYTTLTELLDFLLCFKFLVHIFIYLVCIYIYLYFFFSLQSHRDEFMDFLSEQRVLGIPDFIHTYIQRRS